MSSKSDTPHPTCVTCISWKPVAFGPAGVCQKITEAGASSDNLAVVQGGGETIGKDPRFVTMPEFGCCLHKFREEGGG